MQIIPVKLYWFRSNFFNLFIEEMPNAENAKPKMIAVIP
tara:strand:+ start:345 stop:461 length:117 start_codon:yes stop_codon:yes gene_type:complete